MQLNYVDTWLHSSYAPRFNSSSWDLGDQKLRAVVVVILKKIQRYDYAIWFIKLTNT